MAGFKDKISRKQEEAIIALLSSRNVEDAAKACDVPVRTLYRWLKEPAFSRAYRAARRKAFSQATARLQQSAGAAATILTKVMLDPATPPATRVRSAEIILSQGARAIEIEDIEARVTELEHAADETNPTWRK